MKISKIMLAVASLAVSASTFAAPNASEIAISAGASASTGNLIKAMKNLCEENSGVFSSLGSGNFRSLVCANTAVVAGATGANNYVGKTSDAFVKFAGTDFVELRVNAEGSFSAVELLNGKTPEVFNPTDGTNSSTYPAGSVKVGGLLDLDPALGFPAGTIGSNVLYPTTPVGIAQTFGVAVSATLYAAMFADQQATGRIPAAPTCTVNSTNLPYCVPSIGSAQMATILADNPGNAAYLNGARFLAPSLSLGTLPANTQLRYVRRVNNSGTQGAAQTQFLSLTCSPTPPSVVAEPTANDEVLATADLKDKLITRIRVLAAPGTSNVRAELNKAGLYAIGVMSGENNQAESWRWIRLDGAHMAENAAPGGTTNTNTATMKSGNYNFFFESVYMGGPDGDGFWSTVSGALQTLVAPVGLVNFTDLETGYAKGGNACQAAASN